MSCDQFFSWLDRFAYMTFKMHPVIYRIFLRLVTHWYNVLVLDNQVGAKSSYRRRQQSRRPPTNTQPPRTHVLSTSSTEAAPAVQIQLRRNPRGVGLFGAGKFHWYDTLDTARPPCKRVWHSTLSDVEAVSSEQIFVHGGHGWCVQLPHGMYDVCTNCARALQKANQIS